MPSGKAAVIDEHAFDRRVDPALEAVGGARHGAGGYERGVEECEQGSRSERRFQPAVATSQGLVRPPPFLSGGAGVPGRVPGVGAFREHAAPPVVPFVQLHRPGRGLPRVVHPGDRVGEALELASRLQARPRRQVAA